MLRTILAAAILLADAAAVFPQSSGASKLTTGKQIYQAGCAGCHGSDGKGAAQSTIGFQKPDTWPDFTRCDQTTPEDNLAWKSVIRDGGPSRGFSQIMPSFEEALTPRQIDLVVDYMRGFCRGEGKGWPRGEVNLPRALATEKAFPEDEEVLTTTLNVTGAPGVTNEIQHEERFGVKNQLEVSVPVDFTRPGPGHWYGGVGDIGLGMKRVLFSGRDSILSAQGEVIFPTGNTAHGLGSGVTTFETFAAFGQILPWQMFLQLQGGADLPRDTSKAPQSVFMRSALGRSISENRGLGRLWSPMVEFVGTRDLVSGARQDWDVIPEFQVTLSKRQHVRADLGVRIPATNTAGRQSQLEFYLLWDWQDGKLLEGWK